MFSFFSNFSSPFITSNSFTLKYSFYLQYHPKYTKIFYNLKKSVYLFWKLSFSYQFNTHNIFKKWRESTILTKNSSFGFIDNWTIWGIYYLGHFHWRYINYLVTNNDYLKIASTLIIIDIVFYLRNWQINMLAVFE